MKIHSHSTNEVANIIINLYITKIEGRFLSNSSVFFLHLNQLTLQHIIQIIDAFFKSFGVFLGKNYNGTFSQYHKNNYIRLSFGYEF